MRPCSCIVVTCTALWLSGCVTPLPKPDYSNFLDHHPRSILVVPPANKTTAVDAPDILLTTVSAAFSERGYYVFPVLLVQDILNNLGATDESAIAAIPPEKFKEVFGTDSILYVTITEWATSYDVLASNIIVGAEYRLVDASTGVVFWTGKQKVTRNSVGSEPISLTGKASLFAAFVPYLFSAFQVNNTAAYGLPAGPYHPEFQKDREYFK